MDWLLHIAAVGMVVPASHSAQDCKTAILDVLQRYGVTNHDIKFSMSDTTNSALKTGRELADVVDIMEGKCTMHLVNLAVEHAIGKRTRSRNHVIVDEFPAAEALRKKSLKSIGYLMSKKSKVV